MKMANHPFIEETFGSDSDNSMYSFSDEENKDAQSNFMTGSIKRKKLLNKRQGNSRNSKAEKAAKLNISVNLKLQDATSDIEDDVETLKVPKEEKTVADIFNSILSSDKPILSKCKQNIKDEPDSDSDKNVKSIKNFKRRKVLDGIQFKPNIVKDLAKERQLRIIATQGVIQLFTAIEKHSVGLKTKLAKSKTSIEEGQAYKESDEQMFNRILKQAGKDEIKVLDLSSPIEETKEESSETNCKSKTGLTKSFKIGPRWKVGAEDFFEDKLTIPDWQDEEEEKTEMNL